MPMNRMPRPAITLPAEFACLFFMKTMRMTPKNAMMGAISEILRAMRRPVAVVPIFAPRMTLEALAKSMSPALTKPTAMDVVALLL